MKLILTQTVMNHKNELQAKEGEEVDLITDVHLPVLIVENNRHNRFSVRVTGTNYQELKIKLK